MVIVSQLRDLVKYRELVYFLTLRELKGRYKQSALGMAWAVFQPLSMMAVFSVIFTKFVPMETDGMPYPIFVYCALLPWTFFSSSLNYAIPSLVYNAELIRKIYFPRVVLPLTGILGSMFDFVTASFVFVLMIWYYRISMTWNVLYVIPIFFVQMVFTVGTALFFSCINVFYRDVKNAISVIVQLWIYATPVIYPMSVVPEKYKLIMLLNPMSGIIEGYRSAVIGGSPPNPVYLGVSAVISVAVFQFSYRMFKRLQSRFADVI